MMPGMIVSKRVVDVKSASVQCPSGTKLCSCSCRGGTTAGCGSILLGPLLGDKCEAKQSAGVGVEAIARCCNLPEFTNWFKVQSLPSGPTGLAETSATCLAGQTIIGCGCTQMGLFSGAGCAGARFSNELGLQTCKAYNLPGNAKGVKAWAQCATVPNPSEFVIEADSTAQDATTTPTQLACSNPSHRMVSCACANAPDPAAPTVVKECWGGAVLDGKCECWGQGCLATAVCAKLPLPPQNCKWTDWTDWAVCSVSCGSGTTTRLRSIAEPAMNGGTACDGESAESIECQDVSMSDSVCSDTVSNSIQAAEAAVAPAATAPAAVAATEEKSSTPAIPIAVGGVALVVLAGGGYLAYEQMKEKKQKKQHEEAVAEYEAAAAPIEVEYRY